MDTILHNLINPTIFKKKIPNLKPGMTVRVHQKIKEGTKERVQIFQGLVLALNAGYGADKTFLVRKIVEGVGVEKVFPIYSPNIVKIEIVRQSKVRRAKLYYMRRLFGKSARLKESELTGQPAEEIMEAPVAEVAKEEEKVAA